MLIDSHAHIYDEEYGDGGKSIIESMRADGLEYIVSVGCDIPSSRTCVELADKNSAVYAVVGVHPYDADSVTPENIEVLRALATHKKVVAIGEIGLDFHRPGVDPDRACQIKAMIDQYELARELNKPMVFHIRDGYGEFMEFAKDRDFPESAVLHCFSSSAEVAEFCVKKGLYISFSGTLTYKNAVNLVRAASVVPMDKLLVETDSPYLTPEPFRGRINYPKYVEYVCSRLAEIKGVSIDKMQEITVANTKRFFNLF